MGEQHPLIGHRDHVIVKCARRNCFFGLLDEQGPRRVEPVAPRHGLRCLNMLAGREGAAGSAVNEQLDPRLAISCGQPHVIGRAFVAERRGHRPVHCECGVGEGELELCQSRNPFVTAVRHGAQVGDRQVAAPVGGVGRRTDRRRIGRPHR